MRLTSPLRGHRDAQEQYFALDVESECGGQRMVRKSATEPAGLAERHRKRTSWLGRTFIARKEPTSQSMSHQELERDRTVPTAAAAAATTNAALPTQSLGVPAYLADACIEVGSYVLDLSIAGQEASPATASNGFARAVRTLNRPSNASYTPDHTHGSDDTNPVEAALRARAIFMATRVGLAFPAILERVDGVQPPQLTPAVRVMNRFMELVALRLYTLWPCQATDHNLHADGPSECPVTWPAGQLTLARRSVAMALQRGSLSLDQTGAAAMTGDTLVSTARNRPAAREAEYAVRYALHHIFGADLSPARKAQLVERARLTLERCLVSEQRLSPNERQCMYRFQRLQSPIEWSSVQWGPLLDEESANSSSNIGYTASRGRTVADRRHHTARPIPPMRVPVMNHPPQQHRLSMPSVDAMMCMQLDEQLVELGANSTLPQEITMHQHYLPSPVYPSSATANMPRTPPPYITGSLGKNNPFAKVMDTSLPSPPIWPPHFTSTVFQPQTPTSPVNTNPFLV